VSRAEVGAGDGAVHLDSATRQNKRGIAAAVTLAPRAGVTDAARVQLTASSSTSNTSVAFGGITPPAPHWP
jgi:hypothetical protein